MLEARISELKSRLSEYLAKVRRGETVVVFDRQTPIARLVPLEAHGLLVVDEATRLPKSLLKRSKVRLARAVSVEALLREDRDQR